MSEKEKEYYCIFDPETELLLGYGLKIADGKTSGKLLFDWLSEDSPVYDAEIHQIASFTFPDGSTLDDLAEKITLAFKAPNFPDVDTLKGCMLVPADLNEHLEVIEMHHAFAVRGKFDD